MFLLENHYLFNKEMVDAVTWCSYLHTSHLTRKRCPREHFRHADLNLLAIVFQLNFILKQDTEFCN